MLFGGNLVPAIFKARPNRFLGEVEIGNRRELCFIPNPGRLEELLHPDAEVYLLWKGLVNRKTGFDLVLVDLAGTLVSIDSRMPNKVVAEAMEVGLLREFDGMRIEKREPVFQDSRLDFRLADARTSLMLEVKSCTLVENGTALFPDAPTERGRRHIRALMRALKAMRAAVLFLVQRLDAESFQPNEETDPRFARTLKEAADLGVEVYAYNSRVTFKGVTINRRLPVML